jgi:hypothetical protein
MLSRRLWKETLVLFSVALAPLLTRAQAQDCVPSVRSAGPPVSSPDGRFEVLRVFCSTQTNERQLVVVLRDIKSGASRTLYTYDRAATMVWSPDSRWIAINDFAGSDYTNNVVFSIDPGTQPIDLKQRLLESTPKQRIFGSDHLYLSATEWKSVGEIQLLAWGHDSGTKRNFCRCLFFVIGEQVGYCIFYVM